MRQKAHYVTISEERRLNVYFDGEVRIKLHRDACVQRSDDLGVFKNSTCRVYDNISEASVLRVAKIQDMMAQ